MPAFAVIAPAENARLASSISSNFPRNYRIGPGQFLVNDVGPTAEAVAKKIGAQGENGSFVVISVAGYWGYHDKALWEWLSLNSG